MSGFKERIQKGKIELILGLIMFLAGISFTFFLYDRNSVQSSGIYTLMFGPLIAGVFFIMMGLTKK